MTRQWGMQIGLGLWLLGCLAGEPSAAESFTVATYNLENYLDAPAGTREVKSAKARAKIRESLLGLRATVVALQEIGTTNALLELRAALAREGLDYPYWEHVSGFDTNIFVAVLSQCPIIARRPHARESFLLRGRRFFTSRGFAEVDIQVNPRYTFTLLAAHLKSRRPIPEADEAELREQEALRLREIIDARMAARPNLNLVVVGDFNDVKDSRSMKAVLGRSRTALIDTRPAERNGDNEPNPVPNYSPRNITWTYYYGKEDSYDRIDYILISRGMASEWNREATYVLALPNWGVASDHRPLVAGFQARER